MAAAAPVPAPAPATEAAAEATAPAPAPAAEAAHAGAGIGATHAHAAGYDPAHAHKAPHSAAAAAYEAAVAAKHEAKVAAGHDGEVHKDRRLHPADHKEIDALVVEVYPEEGIEAAALEAAIRSIKIPNTAWVEKFEKEEVAYTIWKMVTAIKIVDGAVGTDVVEDALLALHDHASGKKVVRSVAFGSFGRVA